MKPSKTVSLVTFHLLPMQSFGFRIKATLSFVDNSAILICLLLYRYKDEEEYYYS